MSRTGQFACRQCRAPYTIKAYRGWIYFLYSVGGYFGMFAIVYLYARYGSWWPVIPYLLLFVLLGAASRLSRPVVSFGKKTQ
jgi:CHASE2 domain-containing sensor protein